VVGHLGRDHLVVVAMFEQGPTPRASRPPRRRPGRRLSPVRRGLQAAAAVPGALGESRPRRWAWPPGAERLRWRIAESAHARWDLVQATGVEAELPDDLVEQSLTFVRAQLPGQAACRALRRSTADSRRLGPPLDRLAAFTGRPVPWTPCRSPQTGGTSETGGQTRDGGASETGGRERDRRHERPVIGVRPAA